MPRRHREGIEMESRETPIASGQTWEHRWTHRQSVVEAVSGDAVTLVAARRSFIHADTLRRDYRLVGG